MKTAVVYARYSSESQTEQSIEGQLRVCNDYATIPVHTEDAKKLNVILSRLRKFSLRTL